MRSNGNSLFVAIKISDGLREQLDSSNVSMKPFFAQDDSEFLHTAQIDADDYIGKVIESGASLEVLTNLQMNLRTMLRMICPKFPLSEQAIKVFALTKAPARSYF